MCRANICSLALELLGQVTLCFFNQNKLGTVQCSSVQCSAVAFMPEGIWHMSFGIWHMVYDCVFGFFWAYLVSVAGFMW